MLAALLYWNADNFGKKRFCYQASFRMMHSDCREHTTISANESLPLALMEGNITA
jgi:hypothetical protein